MLNIPNLQSAIKAPAVGPYQQNIVRARKWINPF
jgi:hypothetical protein